MTVEDFALKLDGFSKLKPSDQIDCFAYYLLFIKQIDGFTPKEIESCFEESHFPPYSNISSYLSRKSGKKGGKYLKRKNGRYYLQANFKAEMETSINLNPILRPSGNFISLEIFANTRGYIEKNASQCVACYDIGAYDASLVMARKLLETLIIEVFERKGIASQIKGSSGHFFYLSDLIRIFIQEDGNTWNISRNTKQALPRIKKIADQSAHNRRFSAKRNQLENLKDDIDMVGSELIGLIDYPNWR